MKQHLGILLLAFFISVGLTACMGESESKETKPAKETTIEENKHRESETDKSQEASFDAADEDNSEPERTEDEMHMVITVDGDEAKQLLEEGAILVDVRTKEEHEAGHIEGSILIPYEQMKELAAQKLPDKEKKIVVYCRSGRRSQIAAEELLRLGYVHVYDMGSILSWDN